MKIKWIDGQKEVPGIGVLDTDDVRDIPIDLAKSFIVQGQAVAVVKTRPEKKNKKEK